MFDLLFVDMRTGYIIMYKLIINIQQIEHKLLDGIIHAIFTIC